MGLDVVGVADDGGGEDVSDGTPESILDGACDSTDVGGVLGRGDGRCDGTCVAVGKRREPIPFTSVGSLRLGNNGDLVRVSPTSVAIPSAATVDTATTVVAQQEELGLYRLRLRRARLSPHSSSS